MKKKIIFIAISFVITLALIFSLTKTKPSYNLKFKYSNNDYVTGYVDASGVNGVSYEKIADSEKDKYIKNIENFSYNKVNDTLEITEYKGISETLVIPYDYEGTKIVSISDSFKNDKVKNIYISDNINYLPVENFKNITINCYKGKYCEELKNNNELNVNILNDSDNVDFNYIEFPFEYNVKNDKIEIVKYTGNDSNIIIPTTVNGMEVTTVNFDITPSLNSIYIPDTVTSINMFTKFTTTINEKDNYTVCLIASIISFVLTTIIIIIVKDKTDGEKFTSTPLYIVIFAYLIFISIMIYKFNNVSHMSSNNVLMYSVIVDIMFIIACFTLITVNKRSMKLDTNVKNKTKFIDEMIFKINNISKLNSEYKSKLIDKLKYSDPVSNEIVKDIEDNINMLISKLNDKSSNEEIDNIIKLIENRNDIIKRNK